MEIIAHRGASGAHPEHTIGAYEAAVAEGLCQGLCVLGVV